MKTKLLGIVFVILAVLAFLFQIVFLGFNNEYSVAVFVLGSGSLLFGIALMQQMRLAWYVGIWLMVGLAYTTLMDLIYSFSLKKLALLLFLFFGLWALITEKKAVFKKST